MSRQPPLQPQGVPSAVRIGFTIWVAIWVTVVLGAQGPQNFFWICNLAQFILLIALWRGDVLLASSQLGMLVLVGLGWGVDFLIALALGGSVTGFTAYMFDDELPLLARGVSFYHVALPLFALWLCHRIGYDDRGPWLQCLIGGAAVIGGWLFTEPARNVNWVHTVFGHEQVWLPEPLYVLFLLLAYPLLLYFPGHYLVRRVLGLAGAGPGAVRRGQRR